MISLIKFYAEIYQVDVAGFNIMGNHYHMVVRFNEFKKLKRKNLKKIAGDLYGTDARYFALWDTDKWKKFNRRIFDVSEYMRNIQAKFAKWYNDGHVRKGKFWRDRFKSILLKDEKALRDCLYYVELNAVRANIVERPEKYEGGSLFFRETNQDDWMMNIEDIIYAKDKKTALINYKDRIYSSSHPERDVPN